MNSIKVFKTEISKDTDLPILKVDCEIPYDKTIRVQHPHEIFMILSEVFNHGYETEEIMYMMCLDCTGKVIGIFELARGGFDKVHIDVKSLFAKALFAGACKIVLSHNHPSGEASPSPLDTYMMKTISILCRLHQIELMDFMIVGREKYISYLNCGAIPDKEEIEETINKILLESEEIYGRMDAKNYK